MTCNNVLIDWSEDHDYSQDGPNIYRPADHTIITTAFTSLPAGWENFCWIWNSGLTEFVKSKDIECRAGFTPYPCMDHCGNGVIDIETVDANTNGFGNAMHLDTDGNWIDAKGDAAATMPCMAVALESGTGQKKLLKKGFIRDDSWSWTVGAWIYASYSSTGGWTQSKASSTGEIQQKVGFAYRSNIMFFNPSKSVLGYK